MMNARAFSWGALFYQMRSLLVALVLVTLVAARAGDLDALKVAARSYVAAMDAAVALQENSAESEIIRHRPTQ
jgi:hypothetical protein